MKVYHDNKGMGKKQTKKKRKNESNNSPPWRGAVLRRGGCLLVFLDYLRK
jgi:hypothetical protein